MLNKEVFCNSCGKLITEKNTAKYSLENLDACCYDYLLIKRKGEVKYRKIMADYLGVPLSSFKGREVHHIDGNPKNNDIKNLLLLTCKTHSLIHGKIYAGVRPIQKAYLAAPIDGVSKEIAQNWRQQAYDKLAQGAIISLVPGNETRGLLTPQEIVDLDKCMIENSDALLINLNFLIKPNLGRGSGTLVEMGMALAMNKIIIAFADGDMGTNFFVKGLCGNIFPTMEEAIEVLISINRDLEHRYANVKRKRA